MTDLFPYVYRFARARIASEACTFDITKCKTAAVNMFSDWMADPDSYRLVWFVQ